jgi:hypothetical protein
VQKRLAMLVCGQVSRAPMKQDFSSENFSFADEVRGGKAAIFYLS